MRCLATDKAKVNVRNFENSRKCARIYISERRYAAQKVKIAVPLHKADFHQ